MVQCEMCGADVGDPNRVKVEGAELDVCDECTDFGTEVRTADASSTSTKYSTGDSGSSSGSSSASGGSSTSSSSGGGGGGGSDMFDDVDDLAQDYDERVRQARESHGLSQGDLADRLNEKASLIRKIEHGDVLPSDDVQRELEGELDIDLSAGAPSGDTEWEGSSGAGEYTLGDVVERKD